MPRILAGQPVRLSTTVRDVTTGALVDPGDISAVLVNTLTGASTTYDYNPGPVVRDSVGAFHLDLNSLTAALYNGYWETTGTAAGRKQIVLNVVDALAPSHVAFEDVRARLNVSTLTDAEIEDMLASAIREQENSVGAVAPRTVTETITASGGRLWPATRPVLSVTSATLNGVAQVTSGWTVRYDVITPASGYGFSGTYVVQLVAGRNPVPQDLVEAALLRVQHSYATQRGGGAGASRIIGAATDDVSAGPDGSDFLLMLRALDKEKPYHLVAVA